MATDITSFPIATKKLSERDLAATLDGTETIGLIQGGISKKATINQIQTRILTSNLVHVAKLSDLPTPISGVITLAADTTYLFTTVVDLMNNRLVASANTAIMGTSTENCRIKSTGLTGSPLISSVWSLPMRNISLEAETAFALDATANPNQALDWHSVNLVNCINPGTIKNYGNFISNSMALLNSNGFSFDGTIGTISFTDTIFDTSPGSAAITLAATLTVTRRFRVTNSAFVVLSGETGLNIVSGATIPVEGVILNFCNFAGGGTYLSGITESDNEARFADNRGVDNSNSVGQYYMNNNATVTTISVAGTYTKVLGTTTAGTFNERFTATSNRATYTGALTQKFKISIALSFTGSNGKEIRFRIAKNGTTIASTQMTRTVSGTGAVANLMLQEVVELATNDYLELFVTNETDTNSVTVQDLNVIVFKA